MIDAHAPAMGEARSASQADRVALVLALGLTFALMAPAVFAEAAASDWDVTQPRGETRQVAFTTREGTKMSVDISPDEQWIAFDLLAHVYRVPASGGEAELLTGGSGIATNHSPRYAPDGRTIAFVSDRGGQINLWLMDNDGANPRAVFDNPEVCAVEPTWTPDGEYLIYRRQQTCHRGYGTSSGLWMVHRSGGEGIRILERKAVSWPSVAADGRSVYFQNLACTPRVVAQADTLLGCQQIERLLLEKGEVEALTWGQGRVTSGGALAPEASPDGRWLAFARRIPDGTLSFRGHRFGPRTALWLRDLQQGGERLLMDPIDVDIAEQPTFAVRVLPGYGWAADSGSLVLSQGGQLRRVWLGSGDTLDLVVTGVRVETIPFEAKVERAISERVVPRFRITDEPFEARFLRWHTGSPTDRERLAFHAVGRLWLLEGDGAPRRLTPGDYEPFEYAPAWSPDGRWLAFTSWQEGVGGHLWKIAAGPDAADVTPIQLTRAPGEYLHPVWSPDGEHLALVRGTGASFRGQSWRANPFYELVSLPAEGGATHRLARIRRPPLRDTIARPSYGPDGRIFWLETQPPSEAASNGTSPETRTGLVSVRGDGTERRLHATFAKASAAAPSPDGRWLAFQEIDDIYLAPFPYAGTGSEPPHVERAAAASGKGGLPVRRLSTEGGLFVRWRDRTTVEFGSGRRYATYDVASEATESVDVRLSVPRRIPTGSVAFTGARLVTLEDRRVIEEGDLVIGGSRIVCLGDCDTSKADRVFDAQGTTILPGWIDMHAHHHEEHAGVIPSRNWESAVYLAYGVTTALDNSVWSQQVFTTAELIRAGLGIGPRIFSTGDPLYAADEGGDALHTAKLDSRETVEQEVARRAEWGAVSLKSYMQPQRRHRQWIIDVARDRGLAVTGEAGDLSYTLSLVMDGQTGWEHDLLWPPIYSDVARFVGQAQTVYSPTFLVSTPGPWNDEYFFQESYVGGDEKLRRFMPWRQLLPHTRRRTVRPASDYGFPLFAEALKDILAAGGGGAIGSHGNQHGLGSHWEVWAAASALGPMAALELASLHGARFLGAEEDLGSLAVGKLADLMVLDSNPLDDIRRTTDIRWVMQGGLLYAADTLDELWPEERPFGETYWVDPDALRADDRPTDIWDQP